MSQLSEQQSSGTSRASLYQDVTDDIIRQLEQVPAARYRAGADWRRCTHADGGRVAFIPCDRRGGWVRRAYFLRRFTPRTEAASSPRK
jgi:hypothetical protein